MDQRAAFDQVVKPEILNRIALRHRFLSRMTLGFVAGALTVLTFPPFSLLLLVPVAYSAFWWCQNNANKSQEWPETCS